MMGLPPYPDDFAWLRTARRAGPRSGHWRVARLRVSTDTRCDRRLSHNTGSVGHISLT